MNIFYTNQDPTICAKWHTDRHVVSQLKEAVQLLCTAHRVLNGKEYIDSSSGRKIKRYKLNNSRFDDLLYSATHYNHPSAVWVRESSENYIWLTKLVSELSKEYTHRYGKIHKCKRIGLVDALCINVPNGIPDKPFTEPTPAMPDEYIVKSDSITSYRNYVREGKKKLHNWTNRDVPFWI